jgi:hypothetical protein
MASSENELTPLTAVTSSNIKCIHCIENYVKLSDEQKTPERWDEVMDAVTYVPSWQTQMAGPGQLVMACVTVPVCLDHIKVQKPDINQIASRSGLAIPGIN